MAALTALQRLMKNPKTAKFVESLNHADLPANWADDPEIVDMAAAAYKEMGTETPFWKAWQRHAKTMKDGEPEVFTHTTKGKLGDEDVEAPFSEFKIPRGGTYFRVGNNGGGDELLFGGSDPYMYEVFLNPQNMLDLTSPPKGMKTKVDKVLRSYFTKADRDEIKQMNGFDSWDPVKSLYDGDLYLEAGRSVQNDIMERLRRAFDADAIRFNDNTAYSSGEKSMVVFSPENIKSVHNRGTFNPFDPDIYKGLLPLIAAGGAAAALAPGTAQAAETGTKSKSSTRSGNPLQNELVSAVHDAPEPVTWDDVKHGLSYGTRGVMEGVLGAPAGLLNMFSEPLTGYSFPNAGTKLADAMGLDRPQNDAEHIVYGLNKGASEAVPYVAGGAGLAKGGAGAVQKIGEFLADSPKAQALLGGLLGMFGGGD